MATPIPHILPSQVRNLEHRVGQLEEVVDAYESTLYKLRRGAIRTELMVIAIATQLGLDLPTDADVEAVLDEQ